MIALITVDQVDEHITDNAHVADAIIRWRRRGFTDGEIASLLADDIRTDGTEVDTDIVAQWIAVYHPRVEVVDERGPHLRALTVVGTYDHLTYATPAGVTVADLKRALAEALDMAGVPS